MNRFILATVKRMHRVDCTNRGISSRHNRIWVECADGNVFMHANELIENRMKFVHDAIGNGVHLEPCFPVSHGCVGWMYGGNKAVDAEGNEWKIFDRQETCEDYELLSH